MSALERLRKAGLLVYIDERGKLMVSPRPLLNEELHRLARDNHDQILADLAYEESLANRRQRSLPTS